MTEKSVEASSGGAPAKRRHRVIVWTLIVLASFLLIFSITANWVQDSFLDTDNVTDTTDQILADSDVQEQLSVFAVDQLYANVDVQGELEAQLPGPAKALAGPIAAAARELATNVADKALESPQVQGLVSAAVSGAHRQFVSLIEDENEFVSTTNGEVTLQYGTVIADLAARLGLNPDTIASVQSFIQDFSQKLRERLTTMQGNIESVRSGIAAAESGTLDSDTEAKLTTLNQDAATLKSELTNVLKQAAGIEEKVPSQLKSKFKDLEGVLTGVRQKAALVERRTAAVLDDPASADTAALDGQLETLQTAVTDVLERPVVQSPGQLVIMDSDELSGVQSIFGLLRNLGIVLPILVLLLYIAAIAIAAGWRREALIAVGGGIVVATLFVLTAKRLIGNEVGSLASSDTVKPAIQSVWDILSESLRDRGRFILVIGIGFIAAGAFAGPGRYAVAARRRLAPFLRDHAVASYTIVAAAFLLWLSFVPGISNPGQMLTILLLAVLLAFGVAVLRRQTAREFPPDGA